MRLKRTARRGGCCARRTACWGAGGAVWIPPATVFQLKLLQKLRPLAVTDGALCDSGRRGSLFARMVFGKSRVRRPPPLPPRDHHLLGGRRGSPPPFWGGGGRGGLVEI